MSTEEIRFHASDLGVPLLFSDTPDWLKAAIEDQRIVAYGAGEDYWYLLVRTSDGPKTAAPGDWVSMDASGQLDVRFCGSGS